MNKFLFGIGVILTSIISYFAFLWFHIFNHSNSREEAIESFDKNIPDLINNTIGITAFCILLGFISIFCFYLSATKSNGIFKKINFLLLSLSLFISLWYIWTLL
ncbi:hypothetical protein CGC52_03420 [Capnocytophaga sp. H2931]|nr:hypothetical protein CGC52_03420 [Capnocytophaga sp. H2931]